MNPTNEQELRDKLDEQLETLLGFLGERDDSDSWWGFDTNVGTLEDEIEGTLDSIMKSIQARTNAEIAKEIKLIRDALVGFTGDNDFVIVAIDGRIAELAAERAKLKEANRNEQC